MAGNTFGTYFKITTWGESHGKALGVVIDGCPAGLSLSEADIQTFLDRRKPGGSRYSTPRKEGDEVTILSGVFEGRTTGTAICLMVPNTSVPVITVKLHPIIVRDMPIIPSTPNMVSGTTGAEAVPPAGKPWDGWRPEPLPLLY